MPIKQVKEIYTDIGGNVTVEYADDSTRKFNQADVAVMVYDPSGNTVGLSTQGGTVDFNDVKQTSGVMVYTGATVANGGFVEVPGTGIVVEAGWLQEGDGLDVTLHYEFGGTTATNRAVSIAFQPVADVGTATNLSSIGSLIEASATPKDGAGIWVTTAVSSGLKRSAVGNSAGVGLNTSTFAVTPYNYLQNYRFFARVSELVTASNSITIYRLTLRRIRQ